MENRSFAREFRAIGNKAVFVGMKTIPPLELYELKSLVNQGDDVKNLVE